MLICLPFPDVTHSFEEYHTFRPSFINNVIFIFNEREHKRNFHHSRPSFREARCFHQQWFTESHQHLYILFAFGTQDEPMKKDKCIGLLEVWKLQQLPYYSSLNGIRGSLVCTVIKIRPGRPGKTVSLSPRRPNRLWGAFGTRASHPGYTGRDVRLT